MTSRQVKCDQCGRVVDADPRSLLMDSAPHGWLLLISPITSRLDFCSYTCLRAWSTTQEAFAVVDAAAVPKAVL